MNPKEFVGELKRRNVYKVAIAYAVVGWLVVQIASTVLPTFRAPEWVLQTLVVLVALGFPIALVLAWAFELTPEGIVRTEDVAPNESVARGTGRKLTAIIIAVALMAVGLFLLRLVGTARWAVRSDETDGHRSAASPPIPEKSVAVLPFENL